MTSGTTGASNSTEADELESISLCVNYNFSDTFTDIFYWAIAWPKNSLIQNLDHGERLIFHNRNDSNSDGCHLLCGTIARYHLSSRIAESNLQNQDAWRHNKMILVDIPIWISTILHVDNLWIWLLIDQADMINCLCNEIMFSCEAFCNHQLSLTNIWHGRVMSMALDLTAVTWDIYQADPNEWVFDYLFILTCENIIH